MNGRIHIDPLLKERPLLLEKIIKHEEMHLGDKPFIMDYLNDLKSGFSLGDIFFLMRHKPLFIFSPIAFYWLSKNGSELDYSRLLNLIIFIISIGIIISLSVLL
jgi:hypothetical protein